VSDDLILGRRLRKPPRSATLTVVAILFFLTMGALITWLVFRINRAVVATERSVSAMKPESKQKLVVKVTVKSNQAT
jgi:hypothetical protein